MVHVLKMLLLTLPQLTGHFTALSHQHPFWKTIVMFNTNIIFSVKLQCSTVCSACYLHTFLKDGEYI